MKQPRWLLENDVFSEDLGPLKKAIKSQGMEYHELGYTPFGGELSLPFDPAIHPTLFYGSLNFAKRLTAETACNVFCTLPNYECTKYYAYLGEFLLNKYYVMLPFSELERRKEEIFEMVGDDGCIFVRPSRGDKVFTGKVVKWEEFDQDYKLFGLYDTKPHDMVVAARPYNLIKEWRLIVIDSKIIAGSLYNDRTMNLDYNGFPEDVENFAKLVISAGYVPDKAWVLDICQTKEGSLYVLEIGGFSCAGLYNADPEPIVKAITGLFMSDI